MTTIEVLKIISDINRIRILNIISSVPCFANEIEEILQLGQSNTSKHVKKLAESGIISFRKLGQSKLLYIKETNMNPIISATLMQFRADLCQQEDFNILQKTDLYQNRLLRVKIIEFYVNTNRANIPAINVQNIDLVDSNDIIDIREHYEWEINSIPNIKNIPMSIITTNPHEYLNCDKLTYLICQIHTRSYHLAQVLHDMGFNVGVITGGVDGYNTLLLHADSKIQNLD